MVVTCPVRWFFVDLGTSNDTETGRTGRWKRRKVPREKNERLIGGGRGERWVSSGRKNTLAGPRQRPVRSFDVCGAHSHEDVRTIFYFEYLWPAPAGAQQFHHQAGATWCTQSTRFRRIFHFFFAHSLYLSLSYSTLSLERSGSSS